MIRSVVDFGSWKPEEEERSDVEYWARRLPADWRVRCSNGDDTGLFFVSVEDAAGTERARETFGYERFHDVARFVEKVVARASS